MQINKYHIITEHLLLTSRAYLSILTIYGKLGTKSKIPETRAVLDFLFTHVYEIKKKLAI